jgi:GNAT superfamily N-acetyltransferase
MVIRRPHATELDSTLILLEYQRDEFEISQYDEDFVTQTVKNYNVKATHFWHNAYEGSRPIGCIGGYLVQGNWSKDLYAHLQFFYVLPTHRNQGIYSDMFKPFKEWTVANNVVKIIAGDLDLNSEHINAVIEQQGFAKKEIWIKE